MDGEQPGDPAKAAAAILAALDAPDRRCGSRSATDAVDAIRDELDRRRADVDAYEAVSRAAVFD